MIFVHSCNIVYLIETVDLPLIINRFNIYLPLKWINGKDYSHFLIFKEEDPFLEIYNCLIVYSLG